MGEINHGKCNVEKTMNIAIAIQPTLKIRTERENANHYQYFLAYDLT